MSKLSLHDAFIGSAVAYQILQQPGSELLEWLEKQERMAEIGERPMSEEEMEAGTDKITSSVALRAQATLEKHLKRDLEADEKMLINDAAVIVLEMVGVLNTDPQSFNPEQ